MDLDRYGIPGLSSRAGGVSHVFQYRVEKVPSHSEKARYING